MLRPNSTFCRTHASKDCVCARACVRTFNETLELLGSDDIGLQLYLEGHENREKKLVLLVETSDRVGVRAQGQILNNVLYALGGDGRLGRLGH